MRLPRFSAWWALAGLALLLALLAFARPLDHDESQYIAAAVLARGGLPYRDFAYLQTPLQPLLFAPLTALAGAWTFPVLRLVNAVLGAAAVAFVYAGARAAGASPRNAGTGAALFAACDAFLFSANVARNDMLPALLLSAALWLLLIDSEKRRVTAGRALAIGLLLSAATATKLSYALPALAVGGLALIDRRYRPAWLVLGALPPALLVAWTWHQAPDAFAFDVLRFPTAAPEQFYAVSNPWKLTALGRVIDVLKFLALGPALLALVIVARDRRRGRAVLLLDLLILAGLIAAILPAPTWRQYLLPALPPLFVRLALAIEAGKLRRGVRIAGAIFVAAGLAPSLAMLGASAITGLPLVTAIEHGRALRAALGDAHIDGRVATLSPQFIAATDAAIDPRFAAGPFYFRSTGLTDPGSAAAFRLVDSKAWPEALSVDPPAALLVGGEGAWTSGNPALDEAFAAAARSRGWRETTVPGTPFRLYRAP